MISQENLKDCSSGIVAALLPYVILDLRSVGNSKENIVSSTSKKMLIICPSVVIIIIINIIVIV